jgi:stage IV sporulation protein A
METLVIPAIEDPYKKERARDELPQSGSGRIIMTSEPKFIPEEAAEISPDGVSRMRVRFIDSVGYMVEGAVGAYDEGQPRMVTTPWFDHEIPMTEAAELGTKKVMEEHCSLGLVVTTDGSVADIPRKDYIIPERRAIMDMRATGKPFLVIVNARDPKSPEAAAVKAQILQDFGIEAWVCDCQSLDQEGIGEMLKQLLYRFPLHEIWVHLPRWLDALEQAHPVKAALYSALLNQAGKITTLAQAEEALAPLAQLECVRDYFYKGIDLGTGTVSLALTFPEEMFYRILSDKSGMVIRTDGELLRQLAELAQVKREYEKVSDALSAVMATGYGVVMPTLDQMHLENPELTKKGGTFGVKLKAAAPSIHMIRVDVDTQINPVVGDESQSRDLVKRLSGAEPEELWQSNIFGKSVYELLQEGLSAKVMGLPQEVRGKFRGTLSRIVNEGATGLVCLIL